MLRCSFRFRWLATLLKIFLWRTFMASPAAEYLTSPGGIRLAEQNRAMTGLFLKLKENSFAWRIVWHPLDFGKPDPRKNQGNCKDGRAFWHALKSVVRRVASVVDSQAVANAEWCHATGGRIC